ncbi:MAG: hypothetical protein JRI57_05800 [Deltaproteobacteria bacterium]|nr:hypothetical protein [Deltaproteobacteria bacterium]MBW1952016.1 hypothetical protein [Deltaproteobacteria bacterium]MBW1986080.1 hypothetical protein [Deltaproteobacteria bacterium]MBW2134234.1 hypothetical protein [Deltaproteobacteria bacterium]
MPVWIHLITYLSLLKYYISIAYGILLRDADLRHLWPDLVGMTVLGVFLFGFCAFRFRQRFG